MWGIQMTFLRHSNSKAISTETHRKKSTSSLPAVPWATTCKSQKLKEEEKSHWVVASEVDIVEMETESSGAIRKLKHDLR